MTTTSVLAEGLYFGEGPRWHDGVLWFSDFFDHAVKTCTMDGTVTTEFTTEQHPSGLGWLPDGRMLIVSMQDRRLLRREPDGTLVTHEIPTPIPNFAGATLASGGTGACQTCAVRGDGSVDCWGLHEESGRATFKPVVWP